MKKKWFIPIVTALSIYSELAANCPKIYDRSISQTFTPIDRVLKYMPAVHAFDHLPADGIIRVASERTQEKENFFVRRTLHFSLGELVRAHPNAITGAKKHRLSWENTEFAVITSLGKLIPQLVNINAYDSFILGNFSIPTDAIIVVPSNRVSETSNIKVRVATYDPAVENLRDAVERVIRGEGMWKLQTFEDYDGRFGKEDMARARALLGRQNINTPAFFGELLSKYKHISFGHHGESEIGHADLLAMPDHLVSGLMPLVPLANTASLNRIRSIFTQLKLKIMASYSGVPKRIKDEVDLVASDLAGWEQLIEAEIYARESLGVSMKFGALHRMKEIRNDKNLLFSNLKRDSKLHPDDYFSKDFFSRVHQPIDEGLLSSISVSIEK